jgi:hypothetical protein
MSYRHIYTPVAFNEYKDAVDWYAIRSNPAAPHWRKFSKAQLVPTKSPGLRPD